MSIEDKINKYLGSDFLLEQETSDDALVDMMVDFLLELDDENLSDEETIKLHDILTALDEGGDDEDVGDTADETEDESDDVSEVRILHKTRAAARRKSRLYYKKHKNKIKIRLRKLKPKIARFAKMGRGLRGKKLGLTKRVGTKRN